MNSSTSHRIATLRPSMLFVLAFGIAGSDRTFAQETDGGAFRPAEIQEGHFAALKESSPFTRSLNLSDSLILTGIATLESGEQIATVMNKETKETYVVSDQPNPQGWKMVEVSGNEELEKVAAKISVTGGQVVTVRYSEWQLKPGEAKPASGEVQSEPSQGSSHGKRRGPGFGGGPPPEVMEKLRNLSDEQKQKLREHMMKSFQKNPNMSREERGEAFRKAVEKIQKSD